MKIAICDDEQAVRYQLKNFIQTYAARHLLDYTILEFEQGEPLLEAVRADSDISILFLDIYMTSLSGMDLAEILRREGNNCAIIFVTISTDHYARSYEVDAEHYLVKPITYDHVEKALSRCRRILDHAAKCAVFSRSGKELQIPLSQIRYVEVFRNQTVLHADQDISLRSPLETVLQQLCDRRFLRTHKSFAVNLDQIHTICEHDIHLKSGEQIPLSRTFKKNFEREYGRFLTNTMTGESV